MDEFCRQYHPSVLACATQLAKCLQQRPLVCSSSSQSQQVWHNKHSLTGAEVIPPSRGTVALINGDSNQLASLHAYDNQYSTCGCDHHPECSCLGEWWKQCIVLSCRHGIIQPIVENMPCDLLWWTWVHLPLSFAGRAAECKEAKPDGNFTFPRAGKTNAPAQFKLCYPACCCCP